MRGGFFYNLIQIITSTHRVLRVLLEIEAKHVYLNDRPLPQYREQGFHP